MIISVRSRSPTAADAMVLVLDAGAGAGAGVLRSCVDSSPLRSVDGFAGFAVGGVRADGVTDCVCYGAICCIPRCNCRSQCRMGFRSPRSSVDVTGFNRIWGGCSAHTLNGLVLNCKRDKGAFLTASWLC